MGPVRSRDNHVMTGAGIFLKTVLTLSALIMLILPSTPSGASGKPDFVLAFTNRVLVDVDQRDATAAVRIYTAELAKQIGYTADSYIYQSLDSVVRDIQENRADFIAMSSLDYLRIRSKVDVVLALGHVKGGKGTLRYLLLVNESRGYTKLGDLKNKKLVMPKEDDTATLFLNTLLLRHKYGEMKTFFSSIEDRTKSSQVVLPVFFGQADACITTDVALKTMVEMNPQIGKTLKVLASSKELTNAITVFRRALASDIKENALGVGRSLRDSARGRQVLMLFKIEDLMPLKEADMANVRELLNEYERLKGRR